jgi:hypothetical protein
MSQEKIAVPQHKIEIYMHFIKNGKLHALTAYGPPSDFIPERGVPQGGVESPLLWILAYEICLTKIKKVAQGLKQMLSRVYHAPAYKSSQTKRLTSSY